MALSWATQANATILETLSIPSDGSSVFSTTTLVDGLEYDIEVSGFFDIGSGGLGDAEFLFTADNSFLQDMRNGVELGVLLNGNDVDFGPFNSTNLYSTTLVGDGNLLEASYSDTNFADNVGNLTLTISLVPEPTSAALAILSLFGFSVRHR